MILRQRRIYLLIYLSKFISCANTSSIYSNILLTYASLQELEVNIILHSKITTCVYFNNIWQSQGAEILLKHYTYVPKTISYPPPPYPKVLDKYVIELVRNWNACDYCLEYIKKFGMVEWETKKYDFLLEIRSMLENQLKDLEDKLFVVTILYKKCVSFLSIY